MANDADAIDLMNHITSLEKLIRDLRPYVQNSLPTHVNRGGAEQQRVFLIRIDKMLAKRSGNV